MLSWIIALLPHYTSNFDHLCIKSLTLMAFLTDLHRFFVSFMTLTTFDALFSEVRIHGSVVFWCFFHELLIASMAFEALLHSSSLFWEKFAVAEHAGDLLFPMAIVQVL